MERLSSDLQNPFVRRNRGERKRTDRKGGRMGKRNYKKGDTTFTDWTEIITSGGSRIRDPVPVCPRTNIGQILVSEPSECRIYLLYCVLYKSEIILTILKGIKS